MKYPKILSLCLLSSVLSVSVTYAADFTVLPATGTFNVQEEAVVDIRIDTADKTINAAQAKIKFDPSVLEVKSTSKIGSIFTFWLQEPKFSNAEGTVEFIGGTTNGVSGSSLQVLQITFITKGIGSSDISFNDASIAAADGKGTDILNKSNGAKFTVSSAAVTPQGEAAPTPAAPIPTPVQIQRTPTQATGLPAMPSVNVPLYPNPSNWYNLVSQFTPNWKLPPDISGLSTALNTNPNFVVPPVSEGLFEAKTFPAIGKDGIYYLHVRFQNNMGWGPTAHYRIALDTQPPLPFKIDVKTGLASDNPSPVLSFRTGDALSGVGSYIVKVNTEEPVTIGPQSSNRLEVIQTGIGYLNVRDTPSASGKLVTKVNTGASFEYTDQVNGWYKITGLPPEAFVDEGWVIGTYVRLLSGEDSVVAGFGLGYTMPPHGPGVYTISVQAVDRAGNSVEDKIQVEILPIETPVITSINQKIILGTNTPLTIKGTAIVGTDIIVTIEDKNQFTVLQNETKTNLQGEWEFRFDKELRRGDYLVTVKARDSRGALSLPTVPIKVKFAEKPIISLFGWDVTFRDLLVILVVSGVLAALWFYRKTLLRLAKAQRESTIINRDIKNAFDIVRDDLDKIANMAKKNVSLKSKTVELNVLNKKVKDTLDNIERYSSGDIEKLG